jgi:hypothetical protein
LEISISIPVVSPIGDKINAQQKGAYLRYRVKGPFSEDS